MQFEVGMGVGMEESDVNRRKQLTETGVPIIP